MSNSQLREVEQSTNVSKHEAKLNELLGEMAEENQLDGAIAPRSLHVSLPMNNTISCGCPGGGHGGDHIIRSVPKCRMVNYTRGEITLHGDRDWSGYTLGAYSVRIIKNDVGGFRNGDVDDSEGAVLYRRTNGRAHCGWILAWKATRTEKKVYVEAGPFENYQNMNWSDIRVKLNRASSSTAYFKHNRTGAEVSAKVGTGNDFTAAAVFDVTTITN